MYLKPEEISNILKEKIKSFNFNMEKEEIISLDPLNYIKNVDGVPELDHRISQDYFG